MRPRFTGGVGLLCLLLAAPLSAIDQDGQITLPPGFRIATFASGLRNPRFMAISPKGDLFASLSISGRVVALPDLDGDGRADLSRKVLDGLDRPHGLAFHQGYLYVAENSRILRFRQEARYAFGGREVVVPSLPKDGGHWTRTIRFGPDGKLYASVGSSCNACVEDDQRRAAILRYNSDGTGEQIYAKGLRNAVGIAFHPQTGELWATENGRDWLGDDLPPDELNRIKEGAHYGWPYCYGQRVVDDQFRKTEFCRTTEPAALEFPAHSAVLGLAFYTGSMFPQEYQGDLFVASHGSWNRSVPTGRKIFRVRMKDGRPERWEEFATGWLGQSGGWGSPVDVIVGPDGALYVSDDHAGLIYRITYRR